MPWPTHTVEVAAHLYKLQSEKDTLYVEVVRGRVDVAFSGDDAPERLQWLVDLDKMTTVEVSQEELEKFVRTWTFEGDKEAQETMMEILKKGSEG